MKTFIRRALVWFAVAVVYAMFGALGLAIGTVISLLVWTVAP